jgi:hypothetical protein
MSLGEGGICGSSIKYSERSVYEQSAVMLSALVNDFKHHHGWWRKSKVKCVRIDVHMGQKTGSDIPSCIACLGPIYIVLAPPSTNTEHSRCL